MRLGRGSGFGAAGPGYCTSDVNDLCGELVQSCRVVAVLLTSS